MDDVFDSYPLSGVGERAAAKNKVERVKALRGALASKKELLYVRYGISHKSSNSRTSNSNYCRYNTVWPCTGGLDMLTEDIDDANPLNVILADANSEEIGHYTRSTVAVHKRGSVKRSTAVCASPLGDDDDDAGEGEGEECGDDEDDYIDEENEDGDDGSNDESGSSGDDR